MIGYYQKNLEKYILSSSRWNVLQTKLCYLLTHPHLATGFREDFNGPLFLNVIRYGYKGLGLPMFCDHQ